jgi:hypothetical protein
MSEISPSLSEEVIQFLKTCDERQLTAMLHTIQARLGTPKELGSDMETSQAIAHQLNNLRTARQMQADLQKLG